MNHKDNLTHVKRKTPENLLKLFLIENNYPHEHIPKILAYCPRLLAKYSLEELALACLSDTNLFKPKTVVLKIRPFIYEAIKGELGSSDNVVNFIEEAIAILAKDTIEESLIDMIENTKYIKSLDER